MLFKLVCFFRSSSMRARNNTAPTSEPETTASGRESRSDGEEGSSSSGHNSPIEEKTSHTGKFFENFSNLQKNYGYVISVLCCSIFLAIGTCFSS